MKPVVGVTFLLCAMVGFGTSAEAQQPLGRSTPNTWSARSNSGRTFSGTYTVKFDAATGSATGEWTLFGADGRAAARGGWSAAKTPSGWGGAWRAVLFGRPGEFAGTWKSETDLAPDTSFSRLFERAAQSVMSGTWQMGQQSGAWSIRAFD